MAVSRREVLLSTLFGTGYLGLRALATGLPASLLLGPRRAMAAPMCVAPDKAQFIILSTCGSGDPINASVPGTYEDPKIVHSPDPALGAAPLLLRGRSVTAARPWSTVPQAALDRTCFFHLMTNTPVHPKEPDVLELMGSITPNEMLPSLLAKQMAPCLTTIQTQPIALGARSPSEGLSFGGQAQPIIPPTALKNTLVAPGGPLANLTALRDQTLDQLGALYRQGATTAQRAYLDSLVVSQQQLRGIRQDLLSRLSSITDDGPDSQVTAALILIQMNVAPVLTVHIPFGGDNHHDAGLAAESAQTQSGIATIASLMTQLSALGLADKVTFLSLNVFGRTLGPGSSDGRQHNPNHQVSIAIGKAFAGGVIGGVRPVAPDYGAMPIDPATGAGVPGGGSAVDTLASFGKTVLAAVGVDPAIISRSVSGGAVITGALA